MTGLAELKNARWIRHLIAAWKRLGNTNGNLFAAAITYFSFLALFPLILLGIAVAGFILHSHPAALQTLFNKIASNAPGQVGSTLRDAVKSAIDKRTGVGLIGLAGLLLTGLGWIGNLRAALDAVWGRTAPKENPIKQRLVSLAILAGLGVGLLVSLGLTAGGTALTGVVVRALGLDGIPGMGTLVAVIGVLLAIAGDVVIFFFVLVRIPRAAVPGRVGLKGALLASVGFEVLKVVGTFTIKASAHSATAGPFAGIIAVLVWIQLVVRFLLFCTAWTAELTADARPAAPGTPPLVEPAPVRGSEVSPAAVGAGLVGAGAVAGAVVTVFALRRSRPDDS